MTAERHPLSFLTDPKVKPPGSPMTNGRAHPKARTTPITLTPTVPVLTFKSIPKPLAIRPQEWHVRGLWSRATHGELAGEQKSLKSYVGLIIDVGMAAGLPVFGHFAVDAPQRVLQLIGEGGEDGYLRRLQRICTAYGVSTDDIADNIRYTTSTAASTSPRFTDGVSAMLTDWKPHLVHLDPWYAFHSASVDARNLYEQGAALERVGDLVRSHGASLMINNHFNQTGTGNGLQRISMAGHAEWVDSWLLLRHRDPPNVAAGRFKLRLDVGSRQWGGTAWDLDVDIGRFDEMTGQHDGALSWTIAPAATADQADDGQAVLDARIVDAQLALMRKARARRKPFQQTDLVHDTVGNAGNKGPAFRHLVENGDLVEVTVGTVTAGGGSKRNVPLYKAAPGR